MAPKWFIYLCLTVGSMAGAYVPMLWGAGVFSLSSVILSGIGAMIGVFVAIKVGNSM